MNNGKNNNFNNNPNNKDINSNIVYNLNIEGENTLLSNNYIEPRAFLSNLNCYVNKDNQD